MAWVLATKKVAHQECKVNRWGWEVSKSGISECPVFWDERLIPARLMVTEILRKTQTFRDSSSCRIY